ncbi:MAG: HD domain-containing protein [Phycisphaerae bacterium]
MAAKPAKIFRDPLYNYISIDRKHDAWLLDLLDTPEVQRMRRIHQLGVSSLTYPGADHNRLSHTMGVVHLMQQALEHLKKIQGKEDIDRARAPLLAAAMLHDVGHGPFSHLFEPCLGIDHEVWSVRIVNDPETQVHKVLTKVDRHLFRSVADLIDKQFTGGPAWPKALLSSQLDMDRMDYLRRDSLFSGAGYGHFDYYRILNSFEIYDEDLVWSEESRLAIEEYIFARYYMYQNVYLHKTTRGFEKMIEAMWRRAKALHDENTNVGLVPALAEFWHAGDAATVRQYLKIEEYTVLEQVQRWTEHADNPLADLARRFLERNRFIAIDAPQPDNGFAGSHTRWESALHEAITNGGYDCTEAYCLKDEVKAKYNQPYFPEKQNDEQSARNAIRVRAADVERPVEISTILGRLRPMTERPATPTVRYYVPADLRDKIRKLRKQWTPQP